MPVVFATEVLESLSRHAVACAPEEACGLLARTSSDATIRAFEPIPNEARSSTRYTMDPIAVLRTLTRLRASGHELAALFHSHPEGTATPSEADLDSARNWPGVLQVIRGRDGTLGVFDAAGAPLETAR